MGWFFFAAALLVGALVLDHFGLVGSRPRPISLGRIAGAALLLLGLALFLGFYQ